MNGVGVDVIDVEQVAEAVRAHGQAYLDHVFTAAEQAAAASRGPVRMPESLARRFAAKEAARKVIGTDLRWTDVEVLGPSNRLSCAVSGQQLHVSTSVAAGRVVAVVAVLP